MCFSFSMNSYTSKCQAHTSYGGEIKGSTYHKKGLNFVFRDSTTIIWPKTAKTRVMSWRFLFSYCFFEVHVHVSDGMPPDANNRIRNHIQIESGTSRISTRKHTRTNSKNASSQVIRSGRHGQGSLSQWRFARMTQRLRQNTGCNNAAARSSSFLPGCFSCFSGSDGCQGYYNGWISATF